MLVISCNFKWVRVFLSLATIILFMGAQNVNYTCQLFLRCRREILSWDFWKRHDHFRRFPKKSEVFGRRPKSAEGEVIEKTLIHKIRDREEGIVIYSFTHGFRSLHGSELTYFWKLCQARWQQLTFFNQAWEIGRQAWDQSFQPAGVRVGRYRVAIPHWYVTDYFH